MGATMIEKHVTLDRSMWGSDQAASIEPQGIKRLVSYISEWQNSLGDGIKKVYESEIPIRKKLRRKG
jgi:N-acetylneuraminate synthase